MPSSDQMKALAGRLNITCRKTLEEALGLSVSRTNYSLEIEHWLLKLFESLNSDIAAVIRFYGIDAARLSATIMQSIDQLKTGNTRRPDFSEQTFALAREAWLVASLEFGEPTIRSGHLLLALLSSDALSRIGRGLSSDLAGISVDTLRTDLPTLMADSVEAAESAAAGATRSSATGGGTGVPGPTPSLDQFTIDLTERARNGEIDPILGRDSEIRQVVDILTRRRQNNPILTGEAGVGKTAVVEGFAQRIATGDVPPALQNVSLRTLDLGLLQAGAGVKGEFENRLKSVIEEVQRSPQPIILFIDEAHTMIGAGGQAGQGDAANLLKPALARGELRTVAATTWAEYKQYFETDAALARRFQVVKVEEPTEESAVIMMQGLVGILEEHHQVEILDEAVQESVRLSNRYISGRQLPDKSVSLLDTSCARVAIGHSATPPAVEDCQRTIDQLETSIGILEREAATGAAHHDRIASLTRQREDAKVRYTELNERWEQERTLIRQIRKIRETLSQGITANAAEPDHPGADNSADDITAADGETLNDDQREKLLSQLATLTEELKIIQGEEPLMQPCVDGQAVAEVVAGWTGIPVGRMVSDEINTILNLKDRMEERVVGQSHALDAIAQRIRTSRANLMDPRRPIGVFFLVGPSGVGKTETGITLAELLYGGEQNMTVINMSEFKEEHKVSQLMGSPPGYVGYGKGGVLTEAVRRRPYSVVLLDEMEKAHAGVQDIFYQVFDKGMLRDGEGRDIDFKNTVIIMTSNAATDSIMKMCADPETMPDAEGLASALHPELSKTFKPAFLGRVSVVPYFPLSDDVMRNIVKLQLGRVEQRIREHYDAGFSYQAEVVESIVSRCTEVSSGARNVDRILSGTLLPQLSTEVLSRMATGTSVAAINLTLTDEGAFGFDIN